MLKPLGNLRNATQQLNWHLLLGRLANIRRPDGWWGSLMHGEWSAIKTIYPSFKQCCLWGWVVKRVEQSVLCIQDRTLEKELSSKQRAALPQAACTHPSMGHVSLLWSPLPSSLGVPCRWGHAQNHHTRSRQTPSTLRQPQEDSTHHRRDYSEEVGLGCSCFLGKNPSWAWWARREQKNDVLSSPTGTDAV